MSELVRHATLDPSSHNTQCWRFAVEGQGLTILRNLSRRCPAVDPDDHHVFVTLGCAAENLAHAALADGRHAETRFDATQGGILVALTPTPVQASPLFQAIPARQCTRGDYDGKPLSSDELALRERAGTSNGVRMLLLTDRPAMERGQDCVVQGNTAQLEDPTFVKELKSWVRFNGPDAVRTGDGLLSVCTGNPEIPAWLGKLAFGWFLAPKGENEKYARQIRNSAGTVLVGEAADKANWVEVGVDRIWVETWRTDQYEWLPRGFFILHKVDALIACSVSKSIGVIGYDVEQACYVTRSYDDQGTSDGFTAQLAGQAWSIDGEKVRFRGAFNADGSLLAGTWEQRSGQGRWSPWMDIELRNVT